MTETVLKEIVHRAVRDGAFRAQLRTDPASALAGISLTGEERTALTTGDPARLTALGVDRRMSKAFALGVMGDVSKVIADDPMGTGAFVDEGSSAGSVVVGDPLGAAEVAAAEGTESWSRTHLRMIEQDLDTSAGVASANEDPANWTAADPEGDELRAHGAEAYAGDPEIAQKAQDLLQIERDLDLTQATNIDMPDPGDAELTEY